MAGAAATAAMAALDGDKNGRTSFDPPPVWDGVDPARIWRRCRRYATLWHMDTDLAVGKHGTRFYRSLIGDAKGAARLLATLSQGQGRETQLLQGELVRLALELEVLREENGRLR